MGMLTKYILPIAITLVASKGHAQNAPFVKPISAADSIKLKKYVDSSERVPVYSHRRQRYLDSALAIEPWNAYWWQQKAMPLYKQKKYSVGKPFLDSAVKYDRYRYIDYRAFMECIFAKDYSSALEDFEQAKIVVGQGGVMDHRYDFYIGLCYLQLDQLDEAERHLLATIADQEKAPGFVHFLDLFYLGIVYYQKEDYNAAITTFNKAIKLYPQFSDAKYYKANCLVHVNKREEAEALYKEAGADFKQGYTINEDNAIYETYPYQVSKVYFE